MIAPDWQPYEEQLPDDYPAECAHNLEWAMVRIRRGDLKQLDKIITFVEAMADLFSADFYDDLWNMRNGMLPFQPGDEHYDAESAE